MNVKIRTIIPEDNLVLAKIIRASLEEFGANKPGTVYFDSSTDHLSEVFKEPKSIYFVCIENNIVVGGAGIFPTKGLPTDTCELVKMYLDAGARGKSYASLLLQKCFDFAVSYGYQNIYLETLPELSKAVHIYEKYGFQYLNTPLGSSGHFGCDIRMLKTLSV